MKFTFKDNYRVLWIKESDNSELIAGMCAIAYPILAQLNKSIKRYNIEVDIDIDDFLLAKEVSEENTLVYPNVRENKYSVWMKSERSAYYNLFIFSTAAFVQGILTMANACNVDFRDYLFGYIIDENGEFYILNGYDMIPSTLAVDAPDSNDIEDENYDNEVLLNPYSNQTFEE